MSETELHGYCVLGMLGLAALTAPALVFVRAPYGRYVRAGFGPKLPSRVGWIVMESPAVLLFAWIFSRGDHARELVPLVLLGIWQLHYLQRTFLFPFRMRLGQKQMPILIPALALCFNALNAYVNARWISHLGTYGPDWLADPRFGLGLGLFVLGYAINLRSDGILARLRKPGETGYAIPRGGLHERVASPNYFGEILEWSGWAILTWSLAGLAFAVYTAANLAPRARAHLRWYRTTFPDYPPERRALIPWIW